MSLSLSEEFVHQTTLANVSGSKQTQLRAFVINKLRFANSTTEPGPQSFAAHYFRQHCMHVTSRLISGQNKIIYQY